MRIEATKKATAAKVLRKLREGRLAGGKYIRVAKGLPLDIAYDKNGGNVERHRPEGARCGIGWIMSRKEAIGVEARTLPGITDYPSVGALIQGGMLVTDDDLWFLRLQEKVDSWGGPEADAASPQRRQAIVDHCNDALAEPASHGYDIGNRRSDPVYR